MRSDCCFRLVYKYPAAYIGPAISSRSATDLQFHPEVLCWEKRRIQTCIIRPIIWTKSQPSSRGISSHPCCGATPPQSPKATANQATKRRDIDQALGAGQPCYPISLGTLATEKRCVERERDSVCVSELRETYRGGVKPRLGTHEPPIREEVKHTATSRDSASTGLFLHQAFVVFGKFSTYTHTFTISSF